MGKAGVGIGGDSQKLIRDYGVACGGLVDLADMANERLEPGLVQRWSLAGLTLSLLATAQPDGLSTCLRCWEHEPGSTP